MPYGVDPTKDYDKGFFVIPNKYVTAIAGEENCFNLVEYALDRSAEGYSVVSWYDVDDTLEIQHSFKITIPEKSGDIYISPATYHYDTIPRDCYPEYYYHPDTNERYDSMDYSYINI